MLQQHFPKETPYFMMCSLKLTAVCVILFGSMSFIGCTDDSKNTFDCRLKRDQCASGFSCVQNMIGEYLCLSSTEALNENGVTINVLDRQAGAENNSHLDVGIIDHDRPADMSTVLNGRDMAETCLPSEVSCDDIDNDCDGLIDEDRFSHEEQLGEERKSDSVCCGDGVQQSYEPCDDGVDGSELCRSDCSLIFGDRDTRPLSCESEHCPAGRLARVNIPLSIDETNELGCTVKGRLKGTGLGIFFSLTQRQHINLYTLDSSRPLILTEILGWESGLTGNEASHLSLRMGLGAYQQGDFRMYSEGGLTLEAEVSLNNRVLQSQISIFQLLFSPAQLFRERFIGELTLTEGGLGLNGHTQGYLSRESLLTYLSDLFHLCHLEERSQLPLCENINQTLSGVPEDDLMIFLNLTPDGFDARLNDLGEVVNCTDTDESEQECDLLGVCIQVVFDPVSLSEPMPPLEEVDLQSFGLIQDSCQHTNGAHQQPLFMFCMLLFLIWNKSRLV